MIKTNKKVILGSGSPRRKELLKVVVNDFDIVVSKEDEIINNNLSSEDIVLDIATQKMYNIKGKLDGSEVLITADTVVVYNNKIIGKPKDRLDAFKILKMLQGNCHEVITGVVINDLDNKKIYKFSETSKVYFNNMTDQEIKSYINSGECDDVAGAYKIQGIGGVFVNKIEGSYYNIVGLPIDKVYNILKEIL